MSETVGVDSIIAEWLERRERGDASSAEHLIREHPDIADDLRLRLDALRVVDGLFAVEPPPPPQRIGQYAILREVGRGGMGVVYEARAPQRDSSVALKVLYPGLSDSPDLLRRLQRQVAASKSLAHPAIVCHWSIEKADGKWCCVSDYVRGRSLDKLVSELGAMGPPASGPDVAHLITDRPGRAAELFAPLADALQFAHDKGVIHRDIKPSNLILGDDGRLRLTDLDLARIGGESGAITRPGAVLGTPCYMSPEQALGAPVDARTDVYSLGATLYEWVTLERPFRGETLAEITTEIVSRPPRPPRTIDRGIPKPLETIILKAMEKEPRRRYPSAAALAEDLRRLASGLPIVARPPSPARRAATAVRRSPRAVAVAVLLAAVGITLLARGGDDAARWTAAAERSRADGEIGQAIEEAEEALRIDADAPGARDLRERLERERTEAVARLEREIDAKRAEERRERVFFTSADVTRKEADSRSFTQWGPESRHVECRARERDCERAEASLDGLGKEIEALQRQVEILRGTQRGRARDVECDLAARFLGLWRDARGNGRLEAEAVFLAFAQEHGAAKPETRGRLRITADPPGATLRLFRYVPDATGLRMVPDGPGECLVVTRVHPGSPACAAGLEAGDLVLRVNGEPCGRGLFVASVIPGGIADRAQVRRLDRIEENHGWPVDSLHEWDHRLDGRGDSTVVKVGGRELRIRWGARPGEALGIVPATAQALLAEAAPARGLRISCLKSGVPVEIDVPAGEEPGIACEPTAYPLALSHANIVAADEEVEVDGGSYVIHARLPGFEDLRQPVVVPDGISVEARLLLLPDGSTPAGFVRVPGGTFVLGGDPGIKGGPPRRIVTLGDFFIARYEVTTGEYFDFLHDPEILPLVHRGLLRGSPVLFPRDDGNALTEFLPDGTPRHASATARTPIRGVSHNDALAYVGWLNRGGGKFRYGLASEEQWEAAARGPDGRRYPWGDRFDYACCVSTYWRCEKGCPFDEIGSEPRDESPYGLRDMAGSRQEWTSSNALKGGNYLAWEPSLYSAAYRVVAHHPHRYHGIRLIAVPAE